MSVFLVPDALAGQRIDVVASRVTGAQPFPGGRVDRDRGDAAGR